MDKLGWKHAVAGIVIVIVLAVAAWAVFQPHYEYPDIVFPRPFEGKLDAGIVLQEYSDFQCPACGNAFPLVQQLVQEFGDKIRFEYKHYPLTSIHSFAFDAAMASECANDQKKFWEFHDLLFAENRRASALAQEPGFSRENLVGFAKQLDLNVEGFRACVYSEAKKKVVQADMQQGDALHVPGTPTFFLNGQMVQNYAQLRNMILAQLAKTSAS